MIDCTQVTDFNRNRNELQEFFIFAFAVAGKGSKVTQAKCNYLFDILYEQQAVDVDGADDFVAQNVASMGPLEYMAWQDWQWVEGWLSLPLPPEICEQYWLKESKGGLGKYETWKKMLQFIAEGPLAFNEVDSILRKCSIKFLEEIPGVRFKTSRFFTLHSREDAHCIPLDTHILRFLRDHGHDAPTKTPGGKIEYAKWEKIAIKELGKKWHDSLADRLGHNWLAQADLETWKEYSGNYTDPKDGDSKEWIKK